MPVSPNFREQVLAALQAKVRSPTCEVCQTNNWGVADHPVGLNLTDLSGNVVIPAPQIPAAALICSNCGNVRFHALGALGLLPAELVGSGSSDGAKK